MIKIYSNSKMKELYIDSRYLSDNTSNSYTLWLQRPVKNIKKAQIVALTVNPMYTESSPQNLNIRRGDFIFLDIAELRRPYPINCKIPGNSSQNNSFLSNLSSISTAFGIIQLKELCATTSGNFYTDKKDNNCVEYQHPIDSIDRLTIQWLDYNGDPVPMNSYHMFVLRLECEEN
jgi:hypothetical protein